MSDYVQPEVWHFIALIDGMFAYSKLTANGEDGKIHREDGRSPWEPIYVNDEPVWFRVSREVADAFMVDDEDDVVL